MGRWVSLGCCTETGGLGVAGRGRLAAWVRVLGFAAWVYALVYTGWVYVLGFAAWEHVLASAGWVHGLGFAAWVHALASAGWVH